MIVKSEVVNADEVEVCVTITATYAEWKGLLAQLPTDAWPSWKVASLIRSTLDNTFERVDTPRTVGE